MNITTKRQEEIVNLMKNGWQLARLRGWHSQTILQKGGVGYGGESKSVNDNTRKSLLKKGLIIIDKETINSTYYKLKDGLSEQEKKI